MIAKILRQSVRGLLSNKRTKLALIVRGDLKMGKGKIAAQCAHAAILCYQHAQKQEDKQGILEHWCVMGQPKIVLRVDSYNDLMQLQEAAHALKLVAEVVHDAGRTQLEPGTATVLGLGPASVEHIDKLVAHLKLL